MTRCSIVFIVTVLGWGLHAASGQVWLPTQSAQVRIENTAYGTQEHNTEDSTMVRVGNTLYFVYPARTSAAANSLPFETRMAAFDLTTLQLTASEVVTDLAATLSLKGYHDHPTLVRTAPGDLVVMHGGRTTNDSRLYLNTWEIGPQQMTIPDLFDPQTWGVPAGIPSRWLNTDPYGDEGYGGYFEDVMGVWDPDTGVSHLTGACGFYASNNTPGIDYSGTNRCYFQIDTNGAFEGPFVLVERPGNNYELNFSTNGCDGIIFANGQLVLGREQEGARSLHKFWTTTLRWDSYCTNAEGVPSCLRTDCGSNSVPVDDFYWDYDLYYARSDDGGLHWRNLEGTEYVNISSTGGTLESIFAGNHAFQIYEGDIEGDYTDRATDVDPDGHPVVVLHRYRPGTGVMVGKHVDSLGSPTAWYDLVLLRWTGSSWETHEIDTTRNFKQQKARLHIDAEGRIFVFVDSLPIPSSGLPRYNLSVDNGATWSGWRTFGSSATSSRFLLTYADPLNPNLLHVGWSDWSVETDSGNPGREGARRDYLTFRMTCDLNPAEADCSSNGIADACEPDCNANDTPDSCDLTAGTSLDNDVNGWPDECGAICRNADVDCSGMVTTADLSQVNAATNFGMNAALASNARTDVNRDGQVDYRDRLELWTHWGESTGSCFCPAYPFGLPYTNFSPDCNANGRSDGKDIARGVSEDCDTDGMPDECGSQGILQWASTLIDFSSQRDDGVTTNRHASQATGVPDVRQPANGPRGWNPQLDDNLAADEYITVGFAEAVHADGAVIVENYNGGFVTRINALLVTGGSEQVWSGTDPGVAGSVSVVEFAWPATAELVVGLRVFIDTSRITGDWEAIDAIALRGIPLRLLDCNTNAVPDGCDIAASSTDCNSNSIPDECEQIEPCCAFSDDFNRAEGGALGSAWTEAERGAGSWENGRVELVHSGGRKYARLRAGLDHTPPFPDEPMAWIATAQLAFTAGAELELSYDWAGDGTSSGMFDNLWVEWRECAATPWPEFLQHDGIAPWYPSSDLTGVQEITHFEIPSSSVGQFSRNVHFVVLPTGVSCAEFRFRFTGSQPNDGARIDNVSICETD